MNEENKTTTETEERVTRPEEIVVGYEEFPDDQKLRPLRCRAGSKTDSPCPRDATTWMHPEDRDYPLCGEHAHANELWLESSERGITEEITRDWLRIACAWGLEDLEQLALNAHESAKEEAGAQGRGAGRPRDRDSRRLAEGAQGEDSRAHPRARREVTAAHEALRRTQQHLRRPRRPCDGRDTR